jgi:hypothetical protein
MYDGTLGTKGPWQALVTFQQLIILADKHGDVDMTAEAIARRTTIPLEVVTVGLRELVKPDPHSRTPDEEGRRVIPLADNRDWGWHVVNHDKYRKIRSQEERREYMRQYQRDRRAIKKGTRVNKIVNKSTSGLQSQPIAVGSNQDAGISKAEEASASSSVQNLADHFTDPDHREAYLGYRRAHRHPDSLDAVLRGLERGGMGTVAPVPWNVLGAALMEMRGAQADFSQRAVLGFARKVGTATAGTTLAGTKPEREAAAKLALQARIDAGEEVF